MSSFEKVKFYSRNKDSNFSVHCKVTRTIHLNKHMSLRAGNTLYHRVLENQREFWVVDGFRFGDTSNQDKVWKVKRDRVSGRFFFVNLGIAGLKKWKLPDITDPRYEDETYIALHGGPTNNS